MKAQITQLFTYIMAAVIVGVILFVGTKAVLMLMSLGPQQELEDFESELSSAVLTVASRYGKVSTFTFVIPKAYDEMCMIDSMVNDKFSTGLLSPSVGLDRPLIYNAYTTNTRSNVFLYADDDLMYTFYVDQLDVGTPDNILCLLNTGRQSLILEGLGRTTQVRLS